MPESNIKGQISPFEESILKGLIHKNLQNVTKGGMATRPMVHTMAIFCPNMVRIVTPAVIPPSATYIGFCKFLLTTPFYCLEICLSVPLSLMTQLLDLESPNLV